MYVCAHPIVFVCYLRVFVCISMLLAPAMWHMNASCRKQEWELRRCSTHQCLQKQGQILCDKPMTRPICMCDHDMSHRYVWHDSCICQRAQRRKNMCNLSLWYVCCFTHTDESCHVCEWVVSHMWMSRATHVNEPCHTCKWVVSHMWMSRVTYVNESCHTCEGVLIHMCAMTHS